MQKCFQCAQTCKSPASQRKAFSAVRIGRNVSSAGPCRQTPRAIGGAKLPRSACRRSVKLLRLQCCADVGNGSSRSCSVSVVLLAGGSGKRMGAPIPKQYLELAGQPVAMYSLQAFAGMPEVFELVIVCNPEYRSLFQKYYDELPSKPSLVFAEPGVERQDSVLSGFKAIDRSRADVVAIHDSARPLASQEDTRQCIADAMQVGAAVLGVPVKPTIKQVAQDGTVIKTLQRADLWEVQTPQVIQPDLLEAGFELVMREGLEVTDDVSIIEALGKPVMVSKGSYTNLKVTTPDDMIVAEGFLCQRHGAADATAARHPAATDLKGAAA